MTIVCIYFNRKDFILALISARLDKFLAKAIIGISASTVLLVVDSLLC